MKAPRDEGFFVYKNMLNSDTYITLSAPSTGLYKDKGSKFMAFAFEVTSEAEIKLHLETLKKEYFDARHHCYAWAIGLHRTNFRTFDDGEPSGTAGKPILGQIQSHNLTNILIVVIRYFGGTLLGTGGLIQAYKSAAADAIYNAQLIQKTVNIILKINFDYLVMNDIMKIIKDFKLKPLKQDFGNNCSLELEVRESIVNEISDNLLKVNSLVIL